MPTFKVKYIRTVYETYEALIEAPTEEEAVDAVWQTKYGEPIAGEKRVDSYSDEVDVDDVEIIE